MVNVMLRGDNVRDEEIHIGDTLRVRDWDDLVREYGVDEHGELNRNPFYLPPPKKICGMQFTVTEFERDHMGKVYAYQGLIKGIAFPFWMKASTLEPLIDEEWDVATDDDIKALFC